MAKRTVGDLGHCVGLRGCRKKLGVVFLLSLGVLGRGKEREAKKM